MKFHIEQLETMNIKTKYGDKTKFRFKSGGQFFDAWQKLGFTDKFAQGYSFEAELSGKPYKGVDTIAWPKAGQPSQQSSSAQLDRIEKKIDFIIKILDPVKSTMPLLIEKRIELEKTNIPYDDSPHPTDEDTPF